MTKNKLKIYIAGPYGFSEAGRDFYYTKLIPTLEGCGIEVLDPWKLAPLEKLEAVKVMPYGTAKRDTWYQLNMEIGANNQKLIEESDGMIAVLDGSDVDSGTAAEIGYAFAKGKRILGYRGDFRLAAENEGGIINLQVEYFIRKGGGTIVPSLDQLEEATKLFLI
jgi:nucleoside 2-deoxyribosyltransferase